MPVKITDLTPNQVALCRDLGARVTATTASWMGDPDDAAAEAWEAYRKAGYDGAVQLRTRDAQNLHGIWRKLERAAARVKAQAPVCGWFLNCGRPATGTTPHPVLGEVPTCDRCHGFATG